MPTRGEAGGVPSGTAAYYSFDYGNIHFICLDSYGSDRAERPPQAGDRTQRTTQPADRPSDNSLEEYPIPEGAMLTWLAGDVAASNKDWKIAFWHHPPYTKGSHDSDTEIELIEMRENFT